MTTRDGKQIVLRAMKSPIMFIMSAMPVAVSIITVAMLSSCNRLDFTDEHSEIKKVSEMLYEVTYSDYGSEAPNGSYDAISGDMACSSVRNGNYVGRNFDYYMNQCPTFVIRTTGKDGRYATIGVGRLAGINAAMVESGLPQDKMELLPRALSDGMNEKGQNHFTQKENAGQNSLFLMFLARIQCINYS